MAYRRRHGMSKSSTFKEEINNTRQSEMRKPKLTPSHTFTSVDAIRASSASHRQSSPLRFNKVFDAYEDSSPRSPSKSLWGALAHKAKTILEEDEENIVHHKTDDNHHRHDNNINIISIASPPPTTSRFERSTDISITSPTNFQHSHSSPGGRKSGAPQSDDEHKMIHIQQSPRKLVLQSSSCTTMHSNSNSNNINNINNIKGVDPLQLVRPNVQYQQHPHNHMNPETQLKASRDVAMATAAKAKLLLRELKTVKADLAFSKQRCSQLEQENTILRESRDKGGNPADEDLIRLQLETLLAEKARLANENAFYARENCYLREIVEYHQLTLMHDVVYNLEDDDDEEDEEEEEISGEEAITNMMSPPPLSPTISPHASHLPSNYYSYASNDDQHHLPAATDQPSKTSVTTTSSSSVLLDNKQKDAKDAKDSKRC